MEPIRQKGLSLLKLGKIPFSKTKPFNVLCKKTKGLSMPKTKGFILGIAKTKGFSEKRKVSF